MLWVLITNSFSGEGNLSVIKSKRPKTDSSGIMVLYKMSFLGSEYICCHHYSLFRQTISAAVITQSFTYITSVNCIDILAVIHIMKLV